MQNLSDSQKIFLVFNTSYFGDVLLCDPLCRNIKAIWPDSKVIFIVNKPFYEAAKYLKDVDDVVIFDKSGEHNGLFGILKFIKNFKYKKPYCSIITYRNLRNCLIAKFLGSINILEGIKSNEQIPTWKKHVNLLKSLTDMETKDFPMIYNSDNSAGCNLLPPGEEFITLCTTTKNSLKDIPLNTCIELINKINESGYKAVLTGAGNIADEYSKKLIDAGVDFVNLTNKTTIYELSLVLKASKALISADTGTMHLGCACGVPTAVVFYESAKIANWAPSPEIYNCIIISDNQTGENIWEQTRSLISG